VNLENCCIAERLPAGFVYLHHIDKTIAQELLFATDGNFVGTPLDKYEGIQVHDCSHIDIAQKFQKKFSFFSKKYCVGATSNRSKFRCH
jgi:hypothetical protein